MLTIDTSRFGKVEIDESQVIRFPEGLLGFPEQRDYAILDHKPDTPFSWLQSVDVPELAFVITNPFLFKGDYLDNLSPEEEGFFKSEKDGQVVVLSLVTIPPGHAERATVNLLGPLVIDSVPRIGKQVILANAGYSHRHPLLSA
jgi:flagellar assembly factor FliW